MSDEFHDYDPDTPTEADLDQAYGSKYLSTADIGTRRIRCRIQKVEKDLMASKDGGPKRMRFILFFDTLDKGLILNSTNKDELVRQLGRVPAKWIGATAGVKVDPNVMFAGRRVGGIRIEVLGPAKAATKPAKPAPANEFPEEAGDPGPDLNDSRDFDEAAE